jgi:hypothetical protein
LKCKSKVGELSIEVAVNDRQTIMGANLRVGKHENKCGVRREE